MPDSEVVTHVYDAGGNLLSFSGDKQGVHTHYLDTLTYDKFEQRTYVKLGNGIETHYSYDPASRRLDTLVSAGARTGTFQNLHYGYDQVGNILSLNNQDWDKGSVPLNSILNWRKFEGRNDLEP